MFLMDRVCSYSLYSLMSGNTHLYLPPNPSLFLPYVRFNNTSNISYYSVVLIITTTRPFLPHSKFYFKKYLTNYTQSKYCHNRLFIDHMNHLSSLNTVCIENCGCLNMEIESLHNSK